jgi:hypothetical protein
MILKTKLDDIKKAVVVGGHIPQVFKTLGSYVNKKIGIRGKVSKLREKFKFIEENKFIFFTTMTL